MFNVVGRMRCRVPIGGTNRSHSFQLLSFEGNPAGCDELRRDEVCFVFNDLTKDAHFSQICLDRLVKKTCALHCCRSPNVGLVLAVQAEQWTHSAYGESSGGGEDECVGTTNGAPADSGSRKKVSQRDGTAIYFLVPRKCGIFGVCAEGI
jgi:hypothetical protein